MQASTGIGADSRSQEVFIEVGGYRLAATLWTPPGPGPHPAAVELHGAGPGLRSDYIATVREAFSRGGLAVLAWDRPGCGESTGDWQRQTLEQRAEEAIAAVHFIQQHPEIDPARVGLWGQSQGANVASLVAARSSEVAFVAATSPAGITLAELQVYGLERWLRAEDTPEEQIRAAIDCARAIQDANRRGESYAKVEADMLGPARREPWGRYLTSPPMPNAETWEYWRARGGLPDQDLDPVAIWEYVRCPVLAVWGERDTVMPVSEVALRTAAALAVAGNRDAAVRVFPGAGHGMECLGTGEPAAGYVELLISWARERVGLA
jgi:pimeloyl-ACP methyl ester carboxylesterase